MCGALPMLLEVLDPHQAGEPPHPHVQGVIITSKEEAAKNFDTKIAHHPPNTLISFSDGSHQPEKEAGAAAILLDANSPEGSHTLQALMGNAVETSPYQAKLLSLKLAVANAGAKATHDSDFFWFITDSQTVIRDIIEPLTVRPGMKMCSRVQGLLARLVVKHPGSKISLTWCLSKEDVTAMKQAATGAKAAVNLPQHLALTPATSTINT